MKNNLIYLVVGLILVYIVGSGTLFSTIGTFGWIPFSTNSQSLTNLQLILDNACYTYACGGSRVYDSEFWKLNTPTDYYSGLRQYAGLSGGDSDLTIECGGGSGGSISTLTFNKDIKDKSFMIDYEISSCSNCAWMPTAFNQQLNFGSNGRIEVRKSAIDRTKSILLINGQEISYIDSGNILLPKFTCTSSGGASQTIRLTNPRYKPLFGCNVDNDETVTFDEFTSGSNINIKTLSHNVSKFCIDNAPVIRSFTDKGIVNDAYGELLTIISEGGSYTVNADETVRVYYATKDTDIVLRCGLDQAFNTQTKQCENILREGTPEAVGVGITTGIEIGENQILFKQRYDSSILYFGNVILSGTKPSYSCACDQAIITPPNPSASCWTTQINGNSVNTGSVYKLNDFVSVNYIAEGAIGKSDGCAIIDGDNSNWANNLIINIDRNGLTAVKAPQETYDSTIRVVIDNKLGSFDSSHAGVKIKTTYLLIDRIDEITQSLALPLGQSSFDVMPPQQVLGKAVVEIVPYVIINEKNIYGGSALSANYDVNQVQTITETVLVPTPIEVVKYVDNVITKIEYINQTTVQTQSPKIVYINNTEEVSIPTQKSNLIYLFLAGAAILIIYLSVGGKR